MGLQDKLLDEYFKSLPPWAKQRLFPILTLVLLELGAYEAFARFIAADASRQTFRIVVSDFRWQMTAITMFCLFVGFDLFRSASSGRRILRISLRSIAVVLFLTPVLFFALVRPVTIVEQKVDIFYLDDSRSAIDFDRNLLMKLLNDSPAAKLKVQFNWVDWTDWGMPSGFGHNAFERLEILIGSYQARGKVTTNPIGITSSPLDGNVFSLAMPTGLPNRTIITTADWKERYAPPTVYHYLTHIITSTAIEYRMREMGRAIEEHDVTGFNNAYFDKAPEKTDLSHVICGGHFSTDDEKAIRQTLGDGFYEGAKSVMSLEWLRSGKLLELRELQQGCPP